MHQPFEMLYHIVGDLIRYEALKFSRGGQKFRLNIHNDLPRAPESPCYGDLHGVSRSIPELRKELAIALFKLANRHGLPIDYVSDVPTGSTPLVTTFSDLYGFPMLSPRLAVKGHGTGNEIDGIWEPGKKIIIIDDVRMTGRSLQRTVELYQHNGFVVAACLGVIDRAFREGSSVVDGVRFLSLLSWSRILEYCFERGFISSDVHNECMEYPQILDAYIQTHQ